MGEISMASSEKGQIVHGGQWEIAPKCAKIHKMSQSEAYVGDLQNDNKTSKLSQTSQNDQKLYQVSGNINGIL